MNKLKKNNILTVRLDDSKYSDVKEKAKEMGISLSSLICIAISEYFENHNDSDLKGEEIISSGCVHCFKQGVACEDYIEKSKKNKLLLYDPFSIDECAYFPRECLVDMFGENIVEDIEHSKK